MKKIILIFMMQLICGCGGGGGTTSNQSTPPPPPPPVNTASLNGLWSGSFPIYTCDVTVNTADNVNYTGHISVRQKPVLNFVPEWFSADISGQIGLPATLSNIVTTYPLNGGTAWIALSADNYLTPTKIACTASLHYGTEGFDTNTGGNDWLTKQ